MGVVGQGPSMGAKVYVWNLPFTMDWLELKRIFKEAGTGVLPCMHVIVLGSLQAGDHGLCRDVFVIKVDAICGLWLLVPCLQLYLLAS